MNSDYRRKMWFFNRINQVNLVGYCIAFAAVLVGLGIGVAGFIDVGVQSAALGAILVVALTLESYLLLPFLKCPRCGKPFFRRAGFLANRVPLLNRSCLHCGLNIHTNNAKQA